jgi:OOP family OmpA-OmpF porin
MMHECAVIKRWLVLGCMTAALCPCQASADNAPDTYANDYISVVAGVVFPSRALGTSGTGATISGIYGYQFNPHFLGELNVQSSAFDLRPSTGVDYQNGVTFDVVYQLRDRSSGLLTPFVLFGAGPNYDNFYPNSRDGVSALVEGGIGVVTQPLLHGIRLRLDARYVRDSHEGFHQEPRALFGFEIPLGRIEHRVEITYLPAKAEVREVAVETVIVKEAAPPPPAPDSDGDGIDDAHDKCPDTPKGMRVNADGCVIEDQVVTLEGVHFEFNKTRITRDAAALLDRLSLAFIGQPTLRAEIDGHTDLKGSEVSNMALSQKRAEAVRDYLISRGARPDQLSARGYGKSEPAVSPEHDEADAERNRRVELRVLAR